MKKLLIRFASGMKKLLLRVVSELGAREAIFFAGVSSYFYGRYQEAPTRVFVELGALFIAVGISSHIVALIRSLRGGKG